MTRFVGRIAVIWLISYLLFCAWFGLTRFLLGAGRQ